MGDAWWVAEEVRGAVDGGSPVVALETAVLTHGLPAPQNLETLAAMADAVRSEGALPACVGLLDGVLRVGLAPGDLARLSCAPGVAKAGLSDLAPLAAAKGSAGTTVAATLWAARRAGIRVFATGGIGGVHREAEKTFDVSGDLLALSRYGGCVVCSGAKAVLDLPRTFEALETLGVCVVGYGTWEVPAFFTSSSGLSAPHRADDPGSVAGILGARDRLGLEAAVLVMNPPPPEGAVPAEQTEQALAAALEAARRAGVAGKAVTPFLLRVLGESKGAGFVAANVALLEANARLAARIACARAGSGP